MDTARAWLDRAWTVGVTARGRRVLAVVRRPSSDGARWLHRVVDCTPGRPEVALTPESSDCRDPVILSDGSVVMSTDGGEPGGPTRLAERAPTGAWRMWTDGPGEVVSFAAAENTVVALVRHRATDTDWSADVAVAVRGPARHWREWFNEDTLQLVLLDRRSGVWRDICDGQGHGLSQCSLAVSPDGRWLAFTPARVAEDGVLQRGLAVRRIPRCQRVPTVWGPDNSDHAHPVFSPDGRTLAFVRHTRHASRHGRRQLMVLDLETGEEQAVAASFGHWLQPVAWTEAGGIVCLATVAEQVGAFAVRPGHSLPVRLDTGTWSWDAIAVGDRIWGVGSRLSQPPAVHAIAAAGPPSVARPWPVSPPCPTLFWPADPPGPRPLVLMVHGGPVSAWTDSWHARQAAAFFHDRGFHVLLPNPVGSTGHGDAHVDAIWHDWDACTAQLVSLLHQAADHPDVADLFVFGGSFGGWAANRLATRPDVPPLAGVVTHAGIFDHHAMLGACDEPDAFSWHLGPTSEHLHRADPARHVSRWAAPTLILHGARDYNVPVGQALALHHALEQRDVPHRLVVFPTEGHHILTPRHKARWWDEVARFVAERSSSGLG